MTNDECRMSNDEAERKGALPSWGGFVIQASFVIRHSEFGILSPAPSACRLRAATWQTDGG
jgi:hypothetical protein